MGHKKKRTIRREVEKKTAGNAYLLPSEFRLTDISLLLIESKDAEDNFGAPDVALPMGIVMVTELEIDFHS